MACPGKRAVSWTSECGLYSNSNGDLHTMTELCAIYEITRETGYYWLRRYQQGGLEALSGSSPGSATTSQPDAGGNRGSGAGVAARAHELGAAQVEARARARGTAAAVAGGEHHRRDGGAGRVGGGAAKAAARAALHAAVCVGGCAEPGVVRGFQGMVSHRGRRAHRSADDHRRLQPLSVALPACGEDGLRARAGDFRGCVSRMRAAGGDAHR